MFQCVLFDFDGTLADTITYSIDVYNLLADKYGFDRVVDLDAARNMTMTQFVNAHRIPMWKLPLIATDFFKLQRKGMDHAKVYPGMHQVLSELKDPFVGVVSSNSADNIHACLRANGVDQFFDVVIGYRRLIGKGEAIKKLLKKHKLTPELCLYVGDEIRDIDSARDAGTKIASVTWGINSEAALKENNPDYLLQQPHELLEIVKASKKS